MNKRKVTRQSSCGLLGLPKDLAYQYCVNSITKASVKGIRPQKNKNVFNHGCPSVLTIAK